MTLIFNESLILLDVEAETNVDVLRKMSRKMFEMDLVKKEYEEAIIKREDSFPTGLETKGLSVAIPHADAEFVNQKAICLCVLKDAIPFELMGQNGSSTNVKLVFMLAIDESHAQLELLQKLIGIFRDAQVLQRIAIEKDKAIIKEIINQKLMTPVD